MPSTPHYFTIHRGLTWGGLRCMALDSSSAAVTLNAGTTGLLQARRAPGKPVAFSLPVTFGEATGEILIPEVAEETTAALPRGEFAYDLILIDATGKAWPPIMHGIITVKDSVSFPES